QHMEAGAIAVDPLLEITLGLLGDHRPRCRGSSERKRGHTAKYLAAGQPLNRHTGHRPQTGMTRRWNMIMLTPGHSIRLHLPRRAGPHAGCAAHAPPW